MQQTREYYLKLGRRTAALSVLASTFLATMNLAVGYLAGSTAVLATGFEFLGDVLAACVVLVGMFAAAKPADAKHPYGHGRVETLAGLAVGVILAVGGIGIAFRSLQEVAHVHPPPGGAAVWALCIAIAVRAAMATLKFRVGRKIHSSSLVADAWNDSVDILSAATALVALGLTLYDPSRYLSADHYGGFAVGAFVILTGLRVIRDAAFELMDTMPSDEEVAGIRSVAATVPGVRGVEKCYARRTGLNYHVDLHIEVDPGLTVAESHEIAGMVRSRIRAELNWVADVLVHVEPAPGAATLR